MRNKLRSPFFYVGDKYKLMPQLIKYFPSRINNYYEAFVGGGSSVLYVEANNYYLNDKNTKLIELHQFFNSYKDSEEKLFELLFSLIQEYQLSCSYLGINVEEKIKKLYPKTYFAIYNKINYIKLRESYNQDFNLAKLYLLIIYGFNHMIRFNQENKFNLPVGNVDFNQNVVQALKDYLDFSKNHHLNFSSLDYVEFIQNINFQKDDFIYLDPPYLISSSEYNKLWNSEDETRLYQILDELDSQGIYFGVSNLLIHKGVKNDILFNWMSKYQVYDVKSNYISRFDNSVKKDSREVYITNYEKKRS